MGRLQWSDDLLVGHSVIDRQHKELFSRANALVEAMSRGQGRVEVLKLVQFLQGYVETHFRDEERWMLSLRYPGYAEQKSQHTAFERRLNEIKAEVETQGGSASLAIQLQNEVGDWLVNHIGQSDRKLGAFLAKPLA